MKPWECPRCGIMNGPLASQCTCRPAFKVTGIGEVKMQPATVTFTCPNCGQSVGHLGHACPAVPILGPTHIYAMNDRTACAAPLGTDHVWSGITEFKS